MMNTIIWLSDNYVNYEFIVYISIRFKYCILSDCYPEL